MRLPFRRPFPRVGIQAYLSPKEIGVMKHTLKADGKETRHVLLRIEQGEAYVEIEVPVGQQLGSEVEEAQRWAGEDR